LVLPGADHFDGDARLLGGAGRFLSVRGESGVAGGGQCVDEPIQFIFSDAHAAFAKANETQATFVYQLVKAGVPDTKSPRCFLRTKDAPRHGDLRQMTAMERGLCRQVATSYSSCKGCEIRLFKTEFATRLTDAFSWALPSIWLL
jgi:hypothetical protein